MPWTTLTGSADTLADSHAALAAKIEVDVERPLRDFASTNREMTQMSTIKGNLAAMAKDVERAQQKTDKLRGKGGRAESGRVATADSDLDTAQTHWESQAPYVFENLQSLDETRLNHLRDVLTQFQTHEVDQVERDRVIAEQCLNVLLNVETSDEIKTFALRAVQQPRPTLNRPQRNSITTPSRSFQASTGGGGSSGLTPTLSQQNEELSMQQSGSLPEEKQKGRLKGLRRLGTVMGRKRDSKIPPGALPSTSESPERKQSRPSPFNSLSRFGRSRDNAPTLDSLQETSPRERPRSPMRFGSELFDEGRSGSRQEPSTPTPATRQLDTPQQVNGTLYEAPPGPPPLSIPGGGHQGDLADLEPPKPAESQAETLPAAAESQRDSEGFSVPPQELDPISQAQQEAAASDAGAPQFNVNIRDAPIPDESGSDGALAGMANKLVCTGRSTTIEISNTDNSQQAPPSTNRRAGTVRGRRDNRNSTVSSSFVPPEQSIVESAAEPSSATEEAVAEPTREISPAGAPAPVVEPPASNPYAALTQSPSDVFTPGQVAASTFSPFTPQVEQQSPLALRPDSRAATGLDQTRADNQSTRSSTTSGSQAGAKHPELHETGLNSSIIETVSARFDNGKLTSSSMIGEIAVAYNPANFSSPFGMENIRLENFSSLEKVAPNPAFINQSSDTEGEYSVNLSSLGKTQVAFKYQVRLDESGSQAPLLIAPAYRPEQTQFSVIISYSLSPKFALNGRESIKLSNVMLALTLEGAKATSCQSKPVGTFSRERNLIFWQLNDLTLTPGAGLQKLLARFATETEATGGAVEARWEIAGESVQGLGSGLGVTISGQSAATGSDPFADEGGQGASWKAVPGFKKLTSGNYTAR